MGCRVEGLGLGVQGFWLRTYSGFGGRGLQGFCIGIHRVTASS